MTKGCVLVVDDSPDMRDALSALLLSEGYMPIPAVDGVDALEKLKQILPDLVITDLMMPRMDGIALMETVARDRTYEGVPFILMTGSDVDAAAKRLREACLACDIVRKPINLQDFLALVVGAVTRAHHGRRAAPQSPTAPAPANDGGGPRTRPTASRPAPAPSPSPAGTTDND